MWENENGGEIRINGLPFGFMKSPEIKNALGICFCDAEEDGKRMGAGGGKKVENEINNLPDNAWKSASGKKRKTTQELYNEINRQETDIGGGAGDALRMRRGDHK